MRRLLVLAGLLGPAEVVAQTADPGYRVGIVSESGDLVTWLKTAEGRITQEKAIPVGIMPADIDGPHNLAVSPDNRFYYISIAHGTPYGVLWKMDAAGDTLVGRAPLEMFPTTIGLTPDGELAFVANSDFHGDHPRTNLISVVHTPTMTTITHLPACDMPHGVKSNHAGTRVYISCMNSDELLEIEVATLRITRRARTGAGHDMSAMAAMDHGPGNHPVHPPAAQPTAPAPPAGAGESCAPTFVSVSPDDRVLYVACNHANSLQVWDAGSLTRRKEIPVGAGAYNVEPSPDGRWVIVTNKKAQSFSVVDARSLTEVARVATTKKIVHGVAYSPDGRYAFISQESIGADPGAVDMFDLAAGKVVATHPVPAQPTGIAILRVGR
jgi:DNA-binding beta-propeller fold protein YncE